MGPKDVINQALDMSDSILHKYVDDLTDADLRLRAVKGMHPIALQLGHLISAEHYFLNLIKPGSAPSLPDGFTEAHDVKNPEPSESGFVTKDKYLELLAAQRAATKAVLDAIPDSELDDTRDGKLPPFAPTVGAILVMTGVHSLGHSGQFVAVRRMLNKPIAF